MTRTPDTPTLLPGETITDAFERLHAEIVGLKEEVNYWKSMAGELRNLSDVAPDVAPALDAKSKT
jgi:hypothetical protein